MKKKKSIIIIIISILVVIGIAIGLYFILNDKDKLEEMKKNLSKLGIKDSSTRIYNTLKELIMNDRKFY